jgi:cyclophilin family peptidyl-prolyl cis-trans isomerase
MANMGPNTNTAHFSIMMNPAPHLDGHYTIFGQVVITFCFTLALFNLFKLWNILQTMYSAVDIYISV